MALDATAADAFSTAFSLMKPDDVRKIVAGRPELQVRLLENSDPERLLEFGAR
jgi:thiamine biosynthesis lipoprotein ApbE